ncbi:MAG: DNA mismatch repair endonuclease MutL [Treponema sp.]|nr:DNA mismatch repair endonuclease MutL [Treponema sp.]
MNKMHQIKVLPPEEARRIAAGEVVDRPAALVREFLDNAIDAGAENIDVSIEEGGCKKTEVSDDGSGMSREDLEQCYLDHATSKIRSLNDLDTSNTLGFRGEALAAASAVSRLEIITSTDGREAWELVTGPGDSYPPKIEQTRRTKGTTARAVNLFENIPARKKFLKREGSEGTLCRQIFNEKACVFNNINFRFLSDGKLKVFLPAVDSVKKRFADALLQSSSEAFDGENFLHELNVTGEGFSAVIVIGGPQLYRNDRRQLFVFANGRRIQDFSLIQAMEYGSQGWFPNGAHPIGAVFINVDPSLADFNIHPAKREVRFKDPGAIHHAVSGAVKSFFHKLYLKDSRKDTENAKDTEREEGLFDKNSHGGIEKTITTEYCYPADSLESHRGEKLFIPKTLSNSVSSVVNNSSSNMRYAGRAFGLFILIEWEDKLYIIDQHAAHERILYNKFLNEGIPKQELLSPIPFNTESDDDDNFLFSKQKELSLLGIEIKKDSSNAAGGWVIEALPADWRLSDTATIKEILELRTAGENMAKRWAATMCCRAAIKDGDYPDDETAFALGKEALSLPDPHCPHGRPIWTEINKEALYKAVRRD